MVEARAGVFLFLAATCAPRDMARLTKPHRLNPVSESRTRREVQDATLDHLVIVAIDGVRWQDVFGGEEVSHLAVQGGMSLANGRRSGALLMPELHRIARTAGIFLGSDESKITVSSPSTSVGFLARAVPVTIQ